jgi:hypothetical protein
MADQEYNEEQINSLIAALPPLTDALKDLATSVAKSQQNTSNSFDELSRSAKKAGNILDDIESSEAKAERDKKKRLANEQAAWNEAQMAFTSLGQAVNSTTPRFTDYTSTIQSATDAAASLASNFGLLGEAVSGAIKAFGAVTGAYITQFQEQLDFSDQMRKMGSMTIDLGDSTTNTSDSMTDLAREAGYTSGKLAELSGIIAGQGPAIANFGKGMSDGTEKFLRYIDLSDKQLASFRRLGYTMAEVNEVQTQYMELQRIGGINVAARGKTEGTLQKESLNYLKTLTAISELTGKSAEAQMKDMEQQQAEYRNVMFDRNEQRKIGVLEREAKALTAQSQVATLTSQEKHNLEMQAEAKRAEATKLKNELTSRTLITKTIAATMGAEMGTMVNTAMITGAYDETTTKLLQLGISAGDLQAIFKNTDPKDALSATFGILQEIAEAQGENLEKYTDSLKFMGENAEQFGEGMGLTTESMGVFQRMLSEGDIKGAAALLEESFKDVTDTMEEEADGAGDAAGMLQNLVRAVSTTADGLLDSLGPIAIGGIGVSLGVMGAAALMAAKNLALLGGGGLLKGLGTQVTKLTTLSKANFAPKVAKFMPTVAGPLAQYSSKIVKGSGALAVAGSAYEGYAHHRDEKERTQTSLEAGLIDEKEQDRRNKVSKGEGTGRAVGGATGAVTGALAGAALGSIIPFVGTAIGGIIGAGLGAMALGSVGEQVGGSKNTESDAQEKLNDESLDYLIQQGIYDKDIIGNSEVDINAVGVMKDEGTLTQDHLRAMLQDNDLSNEDEDHLTKMLSEMVESENGVVSANEELVKAVKALNDTIVVANDGVVNPKESDSDTTEVKTLDSGGTLATGEIGLVGELGPELVEGPADVTSRKETALDLDYIKSLMNTIDKMQGGDKANDDIKGEVMLTQDTVNETREIMNKAFEAAGLKSPAPGESSSDQMAQLEELTSPAALDTSGAWDFDLDDMSSPTVDIAPKEVPKPEETSQGSPQLAGDLDKPDAKSDENLKLLADLGMMLGRLDSRMEEQNSLTEKIVQYSSV